MTARIIRFPVKIQRPVADTVRLSAAVTWLLAELEGPVSLVALRALARKEFTEPRDDVHKSWGEAFLEATKEYETTT